MKQTLINSQADGLDKQYSKKLFNSDVTIVDILLLMAEVFSEDHSEEFASHERKYRKKIHLSLKAPKIKMVESANRPRDYETFSTLNSVEHEILNAKKYQEI